MARARAPILPAPTISRRESKPLLYLQKEFVRLTLNRKSDDEEIEWSESNDSNGDAMPGEESDVAASALRAADTRRHGSRKASDRRYAVHLLTLP